MEYLATFGLKSMVNIGKYSIHGAFGLYFQGGFFRGAGPRVQMGVGFYLIFRFGPFWYTIVFDVP